MRYLMSKYIEPQFNPWEIRDQNVYNGKIFTRKCFVNKIHFPFKSFRFVDIMLLLLILLWLFCGRASDSIVIVSLATTTTVLQPAQCELIFLFLFWPNNNAKIRNQPHSHCFHLFLCVGASFGCVAILPSTYRSDALLWTYMRGRPCVWIETLIQTQCLPIQTQHILFHRCMTNGNVVTMRTWGVWVAKFSMSLFWVVEV